MHLEVSLQWPTSQCNYNNVRVVKRGHQAYDLNYLLSLSYLILSSQPRCHEWILWKAQYKVNMARNKFRKFGKHYWEKGVAQEIMSLILKKQCFKEHGSKHKGIFGPQLALTLQINASGTEMISFFVKRTILLLIPVTCPNPLMIISPVLQ